MMIGTKWKERKWLLSDQSFKLTGSFLILQGHGLSKGHSSVLSGLKSLEQYKRNSIKDWIKVCIQDFKRKGEKRLEGKELGHNKFKGK